MLANCHPRIQLDVKFRLNELRNEQLRREALVVSPHGLLLWFVVMTSIAMLGSKELAAQELNIAVATNFVPVLREITPDFEEQSKAEVQLTSGSTGKLYAQVLHGLPVDIFMAANQLHTQKLIEKGLVLDQSSHSYAIGRLAIWVDSKTSQLSLENDTYLLSNLSTLAIAKPNVAPYGHAAKETLENCIQFRGSYPTIVYGENIGQTYSFVATGNADVGLVAYSLIVGSKTKEGMNFLEVDRRCHAPIVQDLVILKQSKKLDLASAFVKFLQTDSIQHDIQRLGYDTT